MNENEYTEVGGVMYCREHDDFAIECYDWSDVCQTHYHHHEKGECDLVPMFVEIPGFER